MLLELLIATFAGMTVAIFTGITPGLHINLASAILFSLSPVLLQWFSPLSLAAFITSMAVTHTFLDFIPGVFLGCPDEKTALAVLPGHRLLLEGRGYEAVKLSTVGCLLCLAITATISPVLILITPFIYTHLQPYIGWILILVVAYMILRDKSTDKRFWSLFVFLMSGVFGLLVFKIDALTEPLLPMLSGLFGISTLLSSLNEKVRIPVQRITDDIEIGFSKLIKSLGAGTLAGNIISIFPGMGPAQAAILGSQIAGNIGTCGFIILVGGIGTVSMIMSFITLLTIEKARNGPIVVLGQIIGSFGIQEFALLLSVALIAGCAATFLSLFIARIFSKLIVKINYTLLCCGIILFVTSLVLILAGWIGFIVLLTGTAIGIIPQYLNVGKNHLMGCLLLPVILYFVL
jgi:putative membrane protein